MLLSEEVWTDMDGWYSPKQPYKILSSVIAGKKSFDEYEGQELLHGIKGMPRVFVCQMPYVSFTHGKNYWQAFYLETGKPITLTDSKTRSETSIRALQQLRGKQS